MGPGRDQLTTTVSAVELAIDCATGTGGFQ